MAQSITDEEIQLKKRARRRLVGAVALVLIVVIFLPMVLDNEPKPVSQDIAIRIPSREGDDFNSKIVPAQEKPASEVKSPAPVMPAPVVVPQVISEVASVAHAQDAPEKKPAETASVKAPVKPAAKPVDAKPAETKEPKPESKPAAKVEAKPVVAEVAHKADAAHKTESTQKNQQSFVVQLGAFSNMDNAKQRQAKLSALGIRFYTGTIKTPSGDKLRVRAGPYASRQEAEKVQAKLKAAGIQDGIVAEKKD